MTTIRHLSAAIAAVSICIGSAASGQVVVAKGSASETILQNSSTTTNINAGTNPLDVPTMFNCKSAKGCVVLMNATYSINYNGNEGAQLVCLTVDGVSGNPNCQLLGPAPDFFVFSMRGQLNVSQGSHMTAATVTLPPGTTGGQLYGWETDYTVYEIK